MLDAEHKGEEACATNGYLVFIWGNGNDGKDCLSDYTTNIEPVIQPVLEWIEKAEAVTTLEGAPA
jgi:hypothetical protein